jgi:hypothetical protein
MCFYLYWSSSYGTISETLTSELLLVFYCHTENMDPVFCKFTYFFTMYFVRLLLLLLVVVVVVVCRDLDIFGTKPLSLKYIL